MGEKVDVEYLKEMMEDILEVMDTIHKELQSLKVIIAKHEEKQHRIVSEIVRNNSDFSNSMFQ